MTWIVEPSVGMMFGPGVRAQPKIARVPETVAPGRPQPGYADHGC
jgi:hypothetical protein